MDETKSSSGWWLYYIWLNCLLSYAPLRNDSLASPSVALHLHFSLSLIFTLISCSFIAASVSTTALFSCPQTLQSPFLLLCSINLLWLWLTMRSKLTPCLHDHVVQPTILYVRQPPTIPLKAKVWDRKSGLSQSSHKMGWLWDNYTPLV